MCWAGTPCLCASRLAPTAYLLNPQEGLAEQVFDALAAYAGHAALVHKRHALSLWKSTKACMRREITLFYRHSFVYFFRLLQACVHPSYSLHDDTQPLCLPEAAACPVRRAAGVHLRTHGSVAQFLPEGCCLCPVKGLASGGVLLQPACCRLML